MKSRNEPTSADSTPTVVVESEISKEGKRVAPTSDEIHHRAYEIHIERGGIHGYDLDDWLQAERELQKKYDNNPSVVL